MARQVLRLKASATQCVAAILHLIHPSTDRNRSRRSGCRGSLGARCWDPAFASRSSIGTPVPIADKISTSRFWEQFRPSRTRTSVANCCSPPMLIAPPSVAAALQPPAHRSLVGQTIPHDRPKGLSLPLTKTKKRNLERQKNRILQRMKETAVF